MLFAQLRPAIMLFIVLSLITGIVYPLTVTALANIFFPHQATGSLIVKDNKVIGSYLIGQPFEDPKYFWGRLSATGPAYNAAASSGSNLGPLNPALTANVQGRIDALKINGGSDSIPVDLVTSSSSGLDPHISIAGALYQIPRVAKVRGLSEETVRTIINQNTTGRFLGVLGEPTVNVLQVNLTLDEVKK